MSSDPFTIIVDHREQRAGYTYENSQIGHLVTGDYSIKEMPQLAVIERKSKPDLYGVVGNGRERFEKELRRITDEFVFSAIVVEASYASLLISPGFTQITSAQVISAIITWTQLFNIPFILAGDANHGKSFSYQFLEYAWRHRQALVDRVLTETRNIRPESSK